MEASGLDFGRPGARFWRAQARFSKVLGRRERCLKAFLGGDHFATDLSCIIGPFANKKWPRSCRATGRLPRMPLLPCPGSDGRNAHGVGGWRFPPPWGLSIRRPPKVCQRRARLISNWLCPITAGQSRHSFAQFDLKCFFPYPFLSPPAWGSPEPSYKFALSASCWDISAVFFAFRIALEK